MAQQQNVEQIKAHLARQFSLPEEQINHMLPSFISTLGSHMRNLENALAEKDLVLLGKTGHTIKGAFLNLGMDECASIALQIEKNGNKRNDSINYRSLVEGLRVMINPLLD